MSVLLDTNIAIDLLDGVQTTIERVQMLEGQFLSVISHVEFEAGIYRSAKADPLLRARLDKFLERIEEVPFTGREATAYSSIIATLGYSRRLVVDRMIAATALANELTLATLNPRDFRGIPGLQMEDWSA